jgi:hypothetical protein
MAVDAQAGDGTFQKLRTSITKAGQSGVAPSITQRIVKVVETWNGGENKLTEFFEAYPIGQAHGTYTDCDLQPYTPTIEKGKVLVELSYEVPEISINNSFGGTTPPPPVGTDARRADANPTEVPLEQSGNWSNSWVNPTDPNWKEGIEGFIKPQPTYSYTYISAFTWSQANLVENVGKRQAPTGLAGADANKWLLMNRSANEIDDTLTEITETWQFAENGWDTDLYGAAT